MASSPLFTLSRKGLLHGVAERIDQTFAYYLASNRSQSELYMSTQSLQGTIQLYNNDPARLGPAIQNDLIAMYQANFDSVTVAVDISPVSNFDNSNRMNIKIDIVVWDNGQPYSVGKVLETINGKVQPMLALNNTGNAA